MLRKFEIAQQLKQHLSPTFFVKSHIVVQVRFTILQINRFTHLSMLHRRLPVLTEIAPLSFIYVVRRSDVIRIPAISDPEEKEYHRCFYRGIRKKKKTFKQQHKLIHISFLFLNTLYVSSTIQNYTSYRYCRKALLTWTHS